MVDMEHNEKDIQMVLRGCLESRQTEMLRDLVVVCQEEEEEEEKHAVNKVSTPQESKQLGDTEEQLSYNHSQKYPDDQRIERCQAVDRLFQSAAAQLMVDIGIEETPIRTVLQRRLESGQSPFSTGEELLRAIFQEEEEQKKQKAVDRLFQSDAAQMMVDIGIEETLIRTVLEKRLRSGQSPFSTGEELLRAIFQEEEEQKEQKAVDRLFQSAAAQMMVGIGIEETVIRTVLQERLRSGQSSFSTGEELLYAIDNSANDL